MKETYANEFEVGLNVMLKDGKTKLRRREAYKIINLYLKNGEPWATLLKTDSQFRSKEYKAKVAELFPIPGFEKADPSKPTEICDNELPASNNKESEIISCQPKSPTLPHNSKEVAQSYVDKTPTSRDVTERPRRKAAENARNAIKQMMTDSVFITQAIKTPPPKHAWDWNTYYDITLDDPDLVRIHEKALPKDDDSVRDLDSLDPELSWDDSPEQMEVSFLNNAINSKVPYPTSEESCSLTEPDSQDDDVFPVNNLTPHHTRLRRKNAFRRNRRRSKIKTVHHLKSSSNDDSTPTEDRQQRYCRPVTAPIDLQKCQPLHDVLNPLIPLAPECVMLDHHVQDLSHPLDVIQDRIPNSASQPTASCRPPRSCKQLIDYKEYHSSGSKLQLGHVEDAVGKPESQRLYLRKPRGEGDK